MPTKAALFRNILRAISQIVVYGCPQMKSPPHLRFQEVAVGKIALSFASAGFGIIIILRKMRQITELGGTST